MLTRIAIVAATLAGLLTAPANAAGMSGGWSQETAFGRVSVSADRRSISVCDFQSDGYGVETQYATSMLATHTLSDTNGAKPGCGEDSVWFGHIDVFKMCQVGFAGRCLDSVWVKDR